MAKKTKRRSAARDQLGCMWGFMNMFTFRHGPLSPKLLVDQNHHAAGDHKNNELDKSNKCRDKAAQNTLVGEERNVTITIIKPSVKKLIAEELFNDNEIKKQRENAEAGQLSDSELEGRRRKNQRRKNKTRKNSCDNFSHINTTNIEEPQVHRRVKKSHHASERSVDIDNMIEEFYSEIHRKSTSRAKNGMLNHRQEDYKEKLRELVKFLISQKLLHGNRPKENSEILTSKDLMEVFQILGSDEELFLKLLQDPEILVPRDISQNPQNCQSQKGEESLSLSEKQSSLADKRWPSLFRRKDTPQEGTDDKACEASDRIFILKPSFSSPDTGCSSPDSHLMRNKLQNERNSSHFFLSEIKRKLKQAIRKEEHSPLQREKGYGERYPKNVPTKDHFFLERMTKPSASQKKSHKPLQENNEEDRKQRVSNIYTEAKKHLSEMLNNGDLDSSSTSRQVQRTLGRILSLPEYLSPLNSPGRRWEKSSTAHRNSASSDYINSVNIKKETRVSQPEDAIIKGDDTQACDLRKEPDNVLESLQPTASEPTERSLDIEDGTANEDKNSAAGSADDLMITNEIGMVTEEASSSLVGDLSKFEAQDDQMDGIISKQTSHEENQPPLASSVSSPSHCLVKSEECKSAASDIPEWSSPISVLEPLFIEDDISPAKIRSQSDEPQVQPWCIHFDEKDPAAKNREDSVKSVTSDKELVFKYVKAVVDAVESDFEELYLKAQFSDQLLEPALISNIPFCPNQLCHDHELLFDCINEVIMELCCCPPWASFVTPRTRVFSTVKSIIHEVQEAVYWHLLPLPLPHALDQIVRKDLAKARNWLDIRCEMDCIGFETSELILEELLEEVALNCLSNTEHSLVPAELKTDESILIL